MQDSIKSKSTLLNIVTWIFLLPFKLIYSFIVISGIKDWFKMKVGAFIQNEEVIQNENDKIKEEEIIDKTVNWIFSDEDFRNKVDNFIIQYTKRYDFDEIDKNDYYDSLNLLRLYINKNIKLIETIPAD